MRLSAKHLLRTGVTLIAATVVAGAGEAAPVVSVYSDISAGVCGAKQRREPADHEVVHRACRVLGAFNVETTYRGTSVSFILRGRGGEARLGAGYSVGDKIEWRGRREGGRFVPDSAIVRLTSRNTAGRPVSAFAILRIDNGRPCTAALLDASGAGANTRARKAADAAASCPCGAGPAVIGPETDSVREVLERGS